MFTKNEQVSWVRGEESGQKRERRRRGGEKRRRIETQGAVGGGWVEAGRTRPRPLPGEGSQVTGQRSGWSYQGLSREHLQQGDEVVSIAEVFVQVRDVPLGLRTEEEPSVKLFPALFHPQLIFCSHADFTQSQIVWAAINELKI